MSFDLFIFEKTENIKTSLDVFSYTREFIEYKENKDYSSLNGCSNIITTWANKMLEKFPPISDEYVSSDETDFTAEKSKRYLTTYKFGENGVYCSFSSDIGEQALQYVISIADEYGVGVYNIQSKNSIFGKGIDILTYVVGSQVEVLCDLDDIEKSIESFEISRNCDEFVTISYKSEGLVDNFIQVLPLYEELGFFKNLFTKDKSIKISGYYFEISTRGSLYRTFIDDKEKLMKIIKDWCIERKEPNISNYDKVMDL